MDVKEDKHFFISDTLLSIDGLLLSGDTRFHVYIIRENQIWLDS